MKKIFNLFGLLCLVIISFIYTEKSMMVVREYDSIMIKIKEQENIPKINSIIVDDTIRPGILEKKINIKESYKKMKQYGFYNKELLVYDNIKSNESLDNNFDKYIIGGNKSKNMISLIFKLNWNSNINKLIDILDSNEITGNIVIDSNWINKDIINTLVSKKHVLLSSDTEVNETIKNVYNQRKQYCYMEQKDKKTIKKCSNEKYYTLLPLKISNNLLIETNNNLISGNILSYDVNNKLINELENIVNCIKNKGFIITNLIEHLEE